MTIYVNETILLNEYTKLPYPVYMESMLLVGRVLLGEDTAKTLNNGPSTLASVFIVDAGVVLLAP
jgi:hypothetical protein